MAFPSSRVVLLKGYDERGFFPFYSNSLSRKGRDIAENPVCLALLLVARI